MAKPKQKPSYKVHRWAGQLCLDCGARYRVGMSAECPRSERIEATA